MTRGAQWIAGDARPSIAASTALGLGQVLSREFKEWRTRALDFGPSLAAPGVAEAVWRELTGPASEPEIAFRQEEGLPDATERWLRLGRSLVPLAGQAQPFVVRPQGVYLITGGLGGIGLRLAEWLRNSQPEVRLVLVGRTPLPPRSGWEGYLRGAAAARSASPPAPCVAGADVGRPDRNRPDRSRGRDLSGGGCQRAGLC